MSSENKISEQECMNVDKETLDQVSGGKGEKILHTPCPKCGSDKYYDYIKCIDGINYYVHHCPDCGYTFTLHDPIPVPN